MDAMTKTEARLRGITILAEEDVNTAEHLRRATEPIVTFKQQAGKWAKKIEAQLASGPLRVGNVVKRHLRPVLEKQKIERKGLRALRHFRVTMLVEAGVAMHTIKAWIGQGSERMVNRYTHSCPTYHQQHLANVPSGLDSSSRESSLSSQVEVVAVAA
jgi:hypothetical protein